MAKPRRSQPSGGRRATNLTSCVVAAIFLIFILIVILIVFFTIFKPKDPKISVTAVMLPSFSISNSSVSFTFSQYVSVDNPNKAAFSHYDSTLRLLYAGTEVGFMFLPAGKVSAGRSQHMEVTFAVQSFPLQPPPLFSTEEAESEEKLLPPPPPPGPGPTVTDGLGSGYGRGGENRVGPSMEIRSRMELPGRVRILRLLSHHVVARADCRVTIAVTDGSVSNFHC